MTLARVAGNRVCLVFLVLTVAVGCSNSGTPVVPIRTPASAAPTMTPSTAPSATPTIKPSPTPSATPTITPSPAPSATSTGVVYVALPDASSLLVYAPDSSGTLPQEPTATISGSNTGLVIPFGVAVDANGKIYVANAACCGSGGSVSVYAANPSGALNEAPLATITGSNTGLDIPVNIAVDAHGTIYVLNLRGGGGSGSVTVYAANPSGTLNEAPLATIAGSSTGIEYPFGLAVDASGKIYVANDAPLQGSVDSQSITVYAANPSGTLNERRLRRLRATLQNSTAPTGSPLTVAAGSTYRTTATSAASGASPSTRRIPAGRSTNCRSRQTPGVTP